MGAHPHAIPLQSGFTYHVYNRGNNGELLFRQPWDYHYFLRKYREYIHPLVKTYSFTLMPNHFHFLVQVRSYQELYTALPKKFPAPPEGLLYADEVFEESQFLYDEAVSKKLSRRFAAFFAGFVRVINSVHNRSDKLLALPFKRILVDDEAYFTNLVCYLHRNAIHHGYCWNYEEWPYSSFHEIMAGESEWLDIPFLMDWFGSLEAFLEEHLNYRDIILDQRYKLEEPQQCDFGPLLAAIPREIELFLD